MPSENTNRLLTESYNDTELFAAESSTLGREEWGKRFSLSNYLGEKLGTDPEQIFDNFNHFNEIYFGDSPLDQTLESARTIEGIQTNTPLPETKPSFVEETGKSLIRGTNAIVSGGVAGVLSAMGLNEQALLVAKEANKVAETLAPHPEVSKELRRIRDEEGVLNQLLDWRWYATTGAELVPNLAVFATTGAGSMALSRLAFKATWAQIAVATATTSTQELFIESGSSISQLTGGAIEAENALEQLRSFPKSEQQALINRGVFKSVQTYEAMIRAGSDPETAGRVASNTFKNDILITVAGTALGLTGGRIAVTKLFKGTKKKDIATALGAFGISLFKEPEEELRQDENIDSAILEEVFRIHVENNFFSSRTLDAILSGDKDKQDVALAAFFMGSKSAVVNLINDVSQAGSLIDGERKLAEGVEQLRQNAKEADNIELQSYLDRYDKAETFEEKTAIWQEAAREVNDKNIDLINEQLAVDIEERVIADEQDQGKRKAANFLRQQEGLDLKFKKKDITNLDQFKADIRQQGGIQTANIEELAELPLTFKGKNGLTADEALEFAKELNLVPQDAIDISFLVPLLKQKSTTEPTIAEKQIDKLTLGTAIDLEGGQRAILFGTDTDGNTLIDIDGELVTQEPGTTLKGQFNEAGANEVERLIAEHGDLVEIEVSKNQEIIGSRTAQILGDLGINVIETDDFSAFSFDPDKTQVISRQELDEIANSEAENASIFEEVNARVKALGFESERVVVIKTAQELPAKIKERARKQLGNDLGQIDGLFNPESGKAFIISGNIKRGRIDQTILHEVGGHLGLDALFGKKKLDKVLLQVFNGLTKKQKAETAAKYDLEEGILEGNLKAKKLNAEEFLAKIAEDPSPDPTLLQKILAAVRQVLRDIGIVTKFSDNDIKVLLARAHKAARKATNKESLQVDSDIRFSLKDSKEIERDVEIDIIGRLFKGGKVTQTDVKSALSKAGGNPLRAADILKGAKTANEILTERAKTLPDLNQLRGQLEQEIAEREKRGFVAGEFVEKARSRVRERVAAKKAEPTRAQLVNKKSSAKAKLEKLKEEDGFELATEIESVGLDKIKPKTEKQKKAAEKAKAKAKEKKKSSEEDVLDPQNRDEILDQIGRPEDIPIAVLGTEQLSSITSTIKKAIPDPLEYKFAFSSALKAAAKKLTFGRDREAINNKIDAIEQLRKPETIDAAINDIIQRINKRRIRDNVDTLLNVFTRLLNSKKIKRKQSRTQELIKDDFHPHERRWLKLVRDVYKRGKVSIEEQLKKTEEFLNAPNAFDDLEKGKSFLFQAREFAPSTKDKFFESIPIEDFAKYYYKALSNYGAMQIRLPVDIAGAIFEIQEDIDTGIKKIEDEIFARNARLEKARNVFINAVDSKVRIRREGFSEFVGQFIQGVFSLRNRLIDSVRFGDSKKEKAAIDFITDLEERQTSANTKEQTEIRLALDRLSKGIEGIYKGRNADNVIHELKQRKDKFIKYSVDGVPLSKTNLLQIYGQLVQKDYEQQREAREKIFGKDYLKNIFAELSAQDKALLNWLRQDAEFARVSLSKVSERVIGVPVVSPGENYLPAIMERDGGLPEEHVSPTLIPKALSLRVKNNLDIKESADILDLWSNRIRDNARFKNHVELNQDLRGVFAHPGVQRSIKLVHGERSLRDILFHVSDHMTGGVKETTKLAALDKIRGLVTLTQLSFNIGVMTRQITSIPAFGFRIGLGNVSKHLINFANPAKVEENIKIFKIIWNSEERKNRFQGGNEEQVSNALSSLNPNVFLKWLRMGMVTNSLGDIAPTMIIGSGIYRAEFEKNIRTMSEPQAKAKALNTLFTIVQATQQSKEQKDLAIWQRRLGVGGRFAGQFKSTQKQFAEFEVLAFREIIANHKSPKAIKQLLNVIAINHFLLPLAYNFVGALYDFALKGFPDEEEKEELLDRLVISMLAGPVSGLIVFGGFVETSIEGLVKGKLPFGKGTFPIERFEDLAVGIVLTLVNMAQFDMDEALKEFDRFLRGATPIYRDLRKFYKGRIEK